MNRYQLVQSEDNITWLSVDPMYQDLLEARDFLLGINASEYSAEDQLVISKKIIAVQSVLEFFGSLLTEQRLRQLKEQLNGKLQ